MLAHVLAGLGLTGCSPIGGAPAIPLFGAYFPGWMACAFGGILGAILVRLVLIRAGIDDAIPIRLPIYMGIAATIGFLLYLYSFG
jgi:hypothetical protein